MNASALTPSQYIKAADFGATLPVNPTLIIREAVINVVPSMKPGAREGDTEKKGVLYFTNEPDGRGWVMNKTNVECLKAMFGDETDNWIGKGVTLKSMPVQVGPKKDIGVRVVGSPDISQEIKCKVKLPKRREETFNLVPTGNASGSSRDNGNTRGREEREDPALTARLNEIRAHATANSLNGDMLIRFFGEFARKMDVPVGALLEAISEGGVEHGTMVQWMGENS